MGILGTIAEQAPQGCRRLALQVGLVPAPWRRSWADPPYFTSSYGAVRLRGGPAGDRDQQRRRAGPAADGHQPHDQRRHALSDAGSKARAALATIFGTWRARGQNPDAACLAALTSQGI